MYRMQACWTPTARTMSSWSRSWGSRLRVWRNSCKGRMCSCWRKIRRLDCHISSWFDLFSERQVTSREVYWWGPKSQQVGEGGPYMLRCHYQSDTAWLRMLMGSRVSHFAASEDKVTRQCPSGTTLEAKREPKQIWTWVHLPSSSCHLMSSDVSEETWVHLLSNWAFYTTRPSQLTRSKCRVPWSHELMKGKCVQMMFCCCCCLLGGIPRWQAGEF